MNQTMREVFLRELISEMQSQFSHLQNHVKIEWTEHPKSIWPEADILIETKNHRYIVEYDEDCDPVRSITKYWPILDVKGKVPITLVGIWRKGQTTGKSFGELAQWIGAKLTELYSPNFNYWFVERKNESA
ncbi:MAG: hypothetical protein PHU23_06835 [Dehalococcoidales bacterium]|nr:hypothetical protein [Dehalococcoidales bacterium]